MTIGERIKRLRCELCLTQDDLALAANTTKQTIHKYETGIIANIPASKIKAIADRLYTTPSYLMGWKEGLVLREEPGFNLKNNSISDIYFDFSTDPEKTQELHALLDSARELTVEQIKAIRQLADTLKSSQ